MPDLRLERPTIAPAMAKTEMLSLFFLTPPPYRYHGVHDPPGSFRMDGWCSERWYIDALRFGRPNVRTGFHQRIAGSRRYR
jgi:hypothetical protein